MTDNCSPLQSGAVALFQNNEFRLEIRQHDTDGFHVPAPGLARALSVTDAHTLLRSIPDEEKGSALARTPGGEQRVGYVTEAGFYRALGQRQTGRITDDEVRATVERFQNWVYREVIPSIRRGQQIPEQREASFDPAKLSRLEILRMAMQAEEEKEVLQAALESATPAIEYHDRFVSEDDVVTVKAWGAQFGLTEPAARDLLVSKNIVYRQSIGRRWSGKHQRVVEEYEYRARAGRVTFDWFDLRPQHNAPRHHNGQVRQTLYIRQHKALELGRKCGLVAVGVQGELIPGGDT